MDIGDLNLASPYRSSAKKADRREQRFAVAWHLAWALAVAAATVVLAVSGGLGWVEMAALAAAIVPGIMGALLAAFAGQAGQVAAILVWAAAAAAASLLTGGVVGPLAAWCLAPLAAASAFRRSERLALGVAASLAVAAVATLSALLLAMPTPPAETWAWLSLLALSTTAVGLGAGLIDLQGCTRREMHRQAGAELRLREILDHQPQLLLGLYPGGRILEVFGARPAGLPDGDLIDRNFGELVAADDWSRVDDALQRAAVEGAAEAGFAPAGDPQGWCQLSLRRLGPTRLAGALRDARGQRARETELEQARLSAEAQNAGKSRFLANMSHELRTPLNAIMGFSDIMRQRLFGPVPDRYGEYAELIHESGAHLLELINDVLDMSKIEAERFELSREDFDARDAVTAVLRLMRGQAERAGVNLRGVLPSETLEAAADRRALKQIALNLVSNALKFTPRGGAVTVTVHGCGEVLELIVADTGVGIAPDDLARLGKPFEQAGDADQRAAGAGLGLSLVRAFARLHGGDMVIESALGEGTTVIVRMPVLLPPQRPAAIRPLGAAAEG